LGGESRAAQFARLPDTTVKLFDEAFALRDPTGVMLEGLPLKITASDGFVEHKSSAQQPTQRVFTKQAEKLKFELRWHQLGD
jgi:type VI secretion system secreted protein VgrG